MTCGNCFHYRSSSRCKNRSASTYNVIFPPESHSCRMHMSNLLKPFGWGFNIIGSFITIALLITELVGNSGGGETIDSEKNGFEL